MFPNLSPNKLDDNPPEESISQIKNASEIKENKYQFCHIEFLDSLSVVNILKQSVKIENKVLIIKKAKKKAMTAEKISQSRQN